MKSLNMMVTANDRNKRSHGGIKIGDTQQCIGLSG